MRKTYRATLSQSQGREGWSVIFRHPVRVDPSTGEPGYRVRRGLGTREREEAERLVAELNELLSDPSYWVISARPTAALRLDPRTIKIFYDALAPETWDFFGIRDRAIPLPSSSDSAYRRVLFVGTTGSGKTTLVRQLLGTDPRTERFPSTSTAKTTVADTEIVLADGAYRAVVTFMPRDQVRDYVDECLSAAVLAAYRGQPEMEILRHLLNHVDQRFRLSYVLGTSVRERDDDDADVDDVDSDVDAADNAAEAPADAAEANFDLGSTRLVLQNALSMARALATRHASQLREELRAEAEDETALEEIFEENLDSLLREDDDFSAVTEELMTEIERRFDLLDEGDILRTSQGWPKYWEWETEDRAAFLRAVGRLSSNFAPYFGTLLTPLVNGIRVRGPFAPRWMKAPSLVLLDGEGLGHTPDSSTSLPTALTKRFEAADAVVLVDNGAQPMQAAAAAVMRGLSIVGRTSKLLFVFTHFDQVVGDNLPTFTAKEQHILASAENVLRSIGEQAGATAERALRRRLESAAYFVGGIHENLDPGTKRGQRTVAQLRALVDAIDTIGMPPAPVAAKPVYDKTSLVLAVRNAAEKFHDAWWARLGREIKPGVTKEHWTRVKALTRRLADGSADHYDTLHPVADLHGALQQEVRKYIEAPSRWKGAEPSDEEREVLVDSIVSRLSAVVLPIAERRLRFEPIANWQEAFNQAGRGSSFARATIITDRIYAPAAPIPSGVPSYDRSGFLREIIEAVAETAQECSAELS